MITYSQDYENKLWEIQNTNLLQRVVLVPHTDIVLNIDLDTRKVEAPEYLSVAKDHQSETVYFKFDRFFERTDLTTMTCIIQYKNANNESYIYPVPYYDKDTLVNEKKILIPWCLQGAATNYAGTVEFSICFYKVDPVSHHVLYMLNTLPSKSKVLSGIDLNITSETQASYSNVFDDDFMETLELIKEARDSLNLYWIDVS